jgi:hypothetical protein
VLSFDMPSPRKTWPRILIVEDEVLSTELKVFHEFDVENRAKGNAGMFTVSLPLTAEAH